MGVPLDNLYNFLYGVAQQDIIIYRFDPHGSTKWHDLAPLFKPTDYHKENLILAVCHDQDPVNVDWIPKDPDHFKSITGVDTSRFGFMIFVHSQKNIDTAKLQIFNAVPVYYWSHALIARDWYRYAKIDPGILYVDTPQIKPFLIYNRAWSGTREYRLKFLHELLRLNVQDRCNVKFSQYDNDLHYTRHVFKNKKFSCDCKFEEFFEPNTAHSSASADYCVKDYLNANIEVVLETVFDQTYLHLTEKTLRPIAVGKPFILASMPGSLEYLRSYGFKTFSPWINESYDQIQDPADRLNAIGQEIKRIADLTYNEQKGIFSQCQDIADYNKKRFFSDDFFHQVVDEFKTNMNNVISQSQQCQHV